jgi:hypothetical protein
MVFESASPAGYAQAVHVCSEIGAPRSKQGNGGGARKEHLILGPIGPIGLFGTALHGRPL